MTQLNGNNGDSSEQPSSRAPVAFPDFRLFDSAQDILDHNKCAAAAGWGARSGPHEFRGADHA